MTLFMKQDVLLKIGRLLDTSVFICLFFLLTFVCPSKASTVRSTLTSASQTPVRMELPVWTQSISLFVNVSQDLTDSAARRTSMNVKSMNLARMMPDVLVSLVHTILQCECKKFQFWQGLALQFSLPSLNYFIRSVTITLSKHQSVSESVCLFVP